ncbi:hypothetical protein AB5I41_13585 [Sphingomonas sp. MMS24-JH45]
MRMQPLVKGDLAEEAEALLDLTGGLTPEVIDQWRSRIAWIYFLNGRDGDARRMAALAQDGGGDWGVHARGRTVVLATWRAAIAPR